MGDKALQSEEGRKLFLTFRKSNFKKEQYLYEEFLRDSLYGFDDYYEHLILEGDIISIFNGPDRIGVCSIFDDILTCVHIMDRYLDDYTMIIENIIQDFNIHQITYSSNDVNMSVYLRGYNYRIENIAINYTFHTYKSDIEHMYRATYSKLKEIKETFGDFHDDYENLLDNHLLFLHYRKKNLVSMVTCKKHIINNNLCSLSVIVTEDFRRKGIAKNCLAYVGNLLIKNGKKIHAGCGYTDYTSRNMLEKAGFVSRNTLSNVYLP